jgi:hypothetical protein
MNDLLSESMLFIYSNESMNIKKAIDEIKSANIPWSPESRLVDRYLNANSLGEYQYHDRIFQDLWDLNDEAIAARKR